MQWFLSTRIGRALSWASVAALAAFGIYAAGRKEGRSQANSDALRDNLKSAKDAKDNRHAIETSDDQRLVDLLTGKLHDDKR